MIGLSFSEKGIPSWLFAAWEVLLTLLYWKLPDRLSAANMAYADMPNATFNWRLRTPLHLSIACSLLPSSFAIRANALLALLSSLSE